MAPRDSRDLPPLGPPGPTVACFAAYFRVRHYEMDALGHVNNAIYLHYLEQAAIEHSAALGFDVARLRALGGVFIARRHEIDYLRPATAGDVLQVVTWAVAMTGAQAVRDYAIYRPETCAAPGEGALPTDGLLPTGFRPTGKPVVLARTHWVWVDPASGRPRRLPPTVPVAFLATKAASGGRQAEDVSPERCADSRTPRLA